MEATQQLDKLIPGFVLLEAALINVIVGFTTG